MGSPAEVATTIGASYGLGRLLGLPHRMATLVACGNSICGNSAIAAVAPVIGADGDDVAAAIAFTAVLGVAAVLGLPLLGGELGMGVLSFGAFAGLTVYAVPQVLAAAAPMGVVAVQFGTLVKLVRVLMLGPVCFVLSILTRRMRDEADEAARSYFGRAAGLRTHVLVSLASATVMVVATHPASVARAFPPDTLRMDPGRIIQGLMTGVGFLGAGVIVKEGVSIYGLTNAASVWMSAALGIVLGLGYFGAGAMATAATLAVLVGLRWVELSVPRQVYALATFRFDHEACPTQAERPRPAAKGSRDRDRARPDQPQGPLNRAAERGATVEPVDRRLRHAPARPLHPHARRGAAPRRGHASRPRRRASRARAGAIGRRPAEPLRPPHPRRRAAVRGQPSRRPAGGGQDRG